MKTTTLSIVILVLFSCAYCAYDGSYAIASTYTAASCCPPTAFVLTGSTTPYAITAVFPSGAQCTTDGTAGLTLTGTVTQTSGTTYTVAFASASAGGTMSFASESAPIFTLSEGTSCVATYAKSAYLLGLGALMVMSFMYLFV